MAALVRNYTIERGIQFSRLVTVTDGSPPAPLDLTGATFDAEIRLSELPTDIRPYQLATGPVVTTFAVSAGATTGQFYFSLPISRTLLLQLGVYDYDVVIIFPNGEKRRLVVGTLTVVEICSRSSTGLALDPFVPDPNT